LLALISVLRPSSDGVSLLYQLVRGLLDVFDAGLPW